MTDSQIDILKTALDWAKAEMFSALFFALFGLVFLSASICFWHFGKTDTAKSYIIPFLVVGILLVILGVGLVISNQIRLSSFPLAFDANPNAFLAQEIARIDKTLTGFETAIFKVIPIIIVIAAMLLLFVKSPIWQASMIAVIAMMAVILVVDTNSGARLASYKQALPHPEHQK